MEETAGTPLERRCHEALEDVTDPELPVNIVDLGLVYDVTAEDDHVDVEMTLTAMGCPAAGMMKGDVEDRLLELDAVETVAVRIVWDPVWTKDRMTERGKRQLRTLGIAV